MFLLYVQTPLVLSQLSDRYILDCYIHVYTYIYTMYTYIKYYVLYTKWPKAF